MRTGPGKNAKREHDYQRELQKQKDRAEIANQFARGCMLLNGGGTLALLAFIQAIVKDKTDFNALATWAAAAVALFVLGLLSACCINYFRGKVSLVFDRLNHPKRARYIWLSRSLQITSPILFASGCAIFIFAIFYKVGLPGLKPLCP